MRPLADWNHLDKPDGPTVKYTWPQLFFFFIIEIKHQPTLEQAAGPNPCRMLNLSQTDRKTRGCNLFTSCCRAHSTWPFGVSVNSFIMKTPHMIGPSLTLRAQPLPLEHKQGWWRLLSCRRDKNKHTGDEFHVTSHKNWKHPQYMKTAQSNRCFSWVKNNHLPLLRILKGSMQTSTSSLPC